MSPGDPLRVGVLSLHNSKETKAILNAIAALGHAPEWLRRENITLTAGAGAAAARAPPVDIVINRLLLSNTPHPSHLLGIADAYASGCPVVNSPAAVQRALHKVAAAAHLDAAGVPTPRSVFAVGAQRLEALRDTISTPAQASDTDDVADAASAPAPDGGTAPSDAVVHKPPIGTHGDGTTKLHPGDSARQSLGGTQGMLQELIDHPDDQHSDVRVYVVADDVVGAMRRYAPADDWRTNVARGGTVEDVTATLPDAARQTALRAAQALGLDCAGVDLVEGPDGWYVLEANPTAGFKGLFDATGISPAPYIAQLAIERAGGTVDAARVGDLATTLDDSIPACRPALQAKPSPDVDVIGYTEQVHVCGRTTSEAVIAKADTGATRTSIDTALAGRIGAGPIVDARSVKTGSTKQGTTRPLVEVGVRIDDYTHRVTANVEDRSHMEHAVLLGRDILKDYSVQVRQRDEPAADRIEE